VSCSSAPFRQGRPAMVRRARLRARIATCPTRSVAPTSTASTPNACPAVLRAKAAHCGLTAALGHAAMALAPVLPKPLPARFPIPINWTNTQQTNLGHTRHGFRDWYVLTKKFLIVWTTKPKGLYLWTFCLEFNLRTKELTSLFRHIWNCITEVLEKAITQGTWSFHRKVKI
jgi:hypothetical protein